jgi:hypothetical protein
MIYSRNLYPENYYSEMNSTEKYLRNLNSLCKPLAPIPVEKLFEEIVIKHQNNSRIFTDELEVKCSNI